MKKKISLLLVLTMLFTLLIGCGSSKSETNEKTTSKPKKEESYEVNMVVPDGIPSIALSQLFHSNKSIDGYKINYSVENTSENVVSQVLKGDVDIAVVPSNVSATQYNKGAGYKIAGTIGWGSFYLISTDGTSHVDDLKGKEIYNIGKGLTPDIIARSILKDYGYNPDTDFNFSYVDGVSELAPLIISGKCQYAIIPEPALSQVMTKVDNVTIIDNLNEKWQEITGSEYGYPQSTIIIKDSFINEHEEFVDEFLSMVEKSCNYVNDNKDDAAEYSEEIGVSANKAIIPKAIEKSNISYIPIKDTKEEYNIYFSKLNEFDPKTIGGNIPDEGIFMEN